MPPRAGSVHCRCDVLGRELHSVNKLTPPGQTSVACESPHWMLGASQGVYDMWFAENVVACIRKGGNFRHFRTHTYRLVCKSRPRCNPRRWWRLSARVKKNANCLVWYVETMAVRTRARLIKPYYTPAITDLIRHRRDRSGCRRLHSIPKGGCQCNEMLKCWFTQSRHPSPHLKLFARCTLRVRYLGRSQQSAEALHERPRVLVQLRGHGPAGKYTSQQAIANRHLEHMGSLLPAAVRLWFAQFC